MAIYTPSIDVKKWYPDKSDLTKWVYDIIKYLHDTPIPTEEAVEKAVDDYLRENPITGVYYSPDNPPPYPVTSVNGQTGAVIVDTSKLYSPTNPPPYPVTSVNGQTGAVDGLYSASNPPPYPVTSVNGKTGAVTVDGFGVSGVKSASVSGDHTDTITISLSGFTPNTYKAIFVNFSVYSSNKDTGVQLLTSNNDYLMTGISDYDETQYHYIFAGIVFYPSAMYDGGTLKIKATDSSAQLTQAECKWWGVS